MGARSRGSLRLVWRSASPAAATPRSASNSFQAQQDASSENPAPQDSATNKPATPAKPRAKKAVPRKIPGTNSAAKPRSTSTHKRIISPRVRRMRQAFVASASLRPMAQQLLQDRSPAGLCRSRNYAHAHAKEDAGALAWLVLGYAHVLDRDYTRAIDPLSRAKVHAGDLGDYVAYYLGTSYLQTGRTAEALATLADFGKAHPDSLLVRDACISYADALLLESQSAEAVSSTRAGSHCPFAPIEEFALGRAYAAAGQTAKAAETFENIYYTMPASVEADAAYAELKKMPSVPPPTASQLKARADGLMSKHRYADAADEYRSLVNQVSPALRPTMQLALADALASQRQKSRRQVSPRVSG